MNLLILFIGWCIYFLLVPMMSHLSVTGSPDVDPPTANGTDPNPLILHPRDDAKWFALSDERTSGWFYSLIPDPTSLSLHPVDEAKAIRLRNRYNDQCNNSGKSTQCVNMANKIDDFLKQLLRPFLPHPGDVRNGPGARKLCLDYTPSMHIAWYNLDDQLCCNGLHNRTSPNMNCCAGAVYHDSDTFCCGRTVYDRTRPSLRCCHDTVYDPATKMCCNNTLYGLDSTSGCCGDKVYNRSTTTCCHNNTQPMYGVENSHGACCGKQSFNLQCHTCNHANKVVPHFDTSVALCCDGNVVRKLGARPACCGRRVLDTTTYICRNGSIEKIPKSTTRLWHSPPTTQNTLGQIPPKDASTQQLNGIEIAALAGGCCVVFLGVAVCVARRGLRRGKDAVRALLWLINVGENNYAMSISDSHHEYDCRYKKGGECGFVEEVTNIQSDDDVSINSGMGESQSDDDISDTLMTYDMQLQKEQPLQQQQRSEEQTDADVHGSEISETTTNSISQCSLKFTLDFIPESDNNMAAQSVVYDINDLTKYAKCPSNYLGNMMTDYIIETGTQTDVHKACNKRNVFGEPFEDTSYLDASNSTFEMDWSSARLVLPEKLLRGGEVEIHGSTFRSIPCVKTKFGISEDDQIASPVVEYHVTGHPELPDCAVCILPFIGKTEDVSVWKFQSDEGRHDLIASEMVPKKGKSNTETDMYYMIMDRHVYIYTRSFSGFYCTTSRQNRTLSLRAFLFGSYKKILERFEIRLMIYIADEIFKFKDFSKRMYGIESMEGRVQQKDQPLDLLAELTGDDLLRLYLTPTGAHEGEVWTHKLHPRTNMPIKDAVKEIPIQRIVDGHNQSEVPYCVEWYLCNADGTRPPFTFECVVDIHCETRREDRECAMSCLVVDELELRSRDVLACTGQALQNPVRLQDIKQIFCGLDENQRSAFVTELGKRIPLVRQTDNLNILLDELQETCTTEGILKNIAAVLRNLRYFDILDALCEKGLIPIDYTNRAVQPVSGEPTGLPIFTDTNVVPADTDFPIAANPNAPPFDTGLQVTTYRNVTPADIDFPTPANINVPPVDTGLLIASDTNITHADTNPDIRTRPIPSTSHHAHVAEISVGKNADTDPLLQAPSNNAPSLSAPTLKAFQAGHERLQSPNQPRSHAPTQQPRDAQDKTERKKHYLSSAAGDSHEYEKHEHTNTRGRFVNPDTKDNNSRENVEQRRPNSAFKANRLVEESDSDKQSKGPPRLTWSLLNTHAQSAECRIDLPVPEEAAQSMTEVKRYTETDDDTQNDTCEATENHTLLHGDTDTDM